MPGTQRPLITGWGLMLLLLTNMAWNLAGFAAREFFLNYSINEPISLFNVSVMISIELPTIDIQLSSAYRKLSNIRRTKSQNLNDSHLVLKSSLPNPLKPGVKSRMKM